MVEKVYDLSKQYDKLTKVDLKSVNNNATASLDVFIELYPKITKEQAQLDLTLCKVLGNNIQINASDKIYSQDFGESIKKEINQLDLIMNGTVYEFQQQDNNQVQVFISFGGLQFILQDDLDKLSKLKTGQKVYLVCYNTSE